MIHAAMKLYNIFSDVIIIKENIDVLEILNTSRLKLSRIVDGETRPIKKLSTGVRIKLKIIISLEMVKLLSRVLKLRIPWKLKK